MPDAMTRALRTTARSPGLVAVCAGSDVMHPIGALVVGGVCQCAVRRAFTLAQHRGKIDDVLGVWPLHGLAELGGIALRIFGSRRLVAWWVSLLAPDSGTARGVAIALIGGLVVYSALKKWSAIRLAKRRELRGSGTLSIHKISANPEEDMTQWIMCSNYTMKTRRARGVPFFIAG